MMPAMRALIGITSMETSIHFKIKRLSNTDLYFQRKTATSVFVTTNFE